MTRWLYEIEDYLEETARERPMPSWARRIVRSIGRTIGGAGDALNR